MLAAALAMAALLATACGSDHARATQPAPGVTSFQPGGFDDLPLPPRSKPVGKRTDSGSVTTRSYKVRGTTPRKVLAFYERVLDADHWTPSMPVTSVGTDAFRGRWVNGTSRLEVSSTKAPGLGDGRPSSSEVETQFSLILRSS